jgi:hypothetical protein
MRGIVFSVVAGVALSLSAQATDATSDREMEKAAAALIDAVGTNHVICTIPGAEFRDNTIPMAFYGTRERSGKSSITIEGGTVTSTEGGVSVFLSGHRLYFELGDGAPHDTFRFDLRKLRKLEPGNEVEGLFYLDDEEPSDGYLVKCHL